MDITNKQIRVRIILPTESRSWILGKFADRLIEYLPGWGIVADIGEEPSPKVDINHWGIYHVCKGDKRTPGTCLITHVDSFKRVQMVKTALKTADIGICLSSDTEKMLINKGISASQLCYITPGSDLEIKPRRIVIGLTTNIYPNKCKREDVLIRLAQTRNLSSFEFSIFGKGWEGITPILEAAGAIVNIDPGSDNYIADYQRILLGVPKFDYYLYMGLDEGSMGLIDALAAGVPTIVTPQGFHLDIPAGITYPFWDTNDLAKIFNEIEQDRNSRIQSVQSLTWNEYAHKHALLWRALLSNHIQDVRPYLVVSQNPNNSKPLPTSLFFRIMTKIQFYLRPVNNFLRQVRLIFQKK
jgi:hypothetical protein